MLQAIFTCNPDVNYCDKFNRTPLHLACISGNNTGIGLLLQTQKVNINA